MSTPTQDQRPGGRRPSAQARSISPFWLAGGLLLLMLLVNVVMSGIRDGETIQYSQFKILRE